jgi:predicted nucleic acid-binding protein
VTHLVIDATIAIKWVVEEPGTRQALGLSRHALLAPDLLVAECANILWKKTRRNELSEDEAFLAARLAARADLELAPTRPLLERAARIAVALDHPAYDCVHVALAEFRGCEFVTTDMALVRKALAAGFGSGVSGLEALPP